MKKNDGLFISVKLRVKVKKKKVEINTEIWPTLKSK